MTVSNLVRRLEDLRAADRPSVGGKAAGLGELTSAGVRVPPGCAVTTAAFERFRAIVDPGGGILADIEALDPADGDATVAVSERVRRRVEDTPMPADLAEPIVAEYRALGGGRGEPAPVAVRSSATSEDGDAASFAGLQDTYLWVRGEQAVLEHVRRCWSSLYSVESLSYRRRLGLPERGLAMAVVLQRMVDARCAGVMFTRSPTTGDRSVVAVEASWGLGSALVSGDVTPDSFVVGKVTGEICRRTVSSKLRRHRMEPGGTGVLVEDVPPDLRDRPCLTDAEIHLLARTARKVEAHYGRAQDIEWALAADEPEGENLLLLQSRPETVWSSREDAPAAAPRARAFDHVVAMFGGAATSGGSGA
jgi:pyruvate, water dikinase